MQPPPMIQPPPTAATASHPCSSSSRCYNITYFVIARFAVLRTGYVEQLLFYCFPMFPILALSPPGHPVDVRYSDVRGENGLQYCCMTLYFLEMTCVWAPSFSGFAEVEKRQGNELLSGGRETRHLINFALNLPRSRKTLCLLHVSGLTKYVNTSGQYICNCSNVICSSCRPHSCGCRRAVCMLYGFQL